MNLLKGLALRSEATNGLALRRVSTKGFTIVELLVVIAVVGVLATVLIVTINPGSQIKKSNDAQRKVALKNVQSALEQYYADNGSYPTTDCWSGNTTSTRCWVLNNGATNLLGINAANYIKVMPTDPKQTTSTSCGSSSYGMFYDYDSTLPGYRLSTRLENTSDTQIVTVPGCTAMNYMITNQQ